MPKFRKKPVEVEAMQYDGQNEAAIREALGAHLYPIDPEDRADDPRACASLYVAANSVYIGIVPGEWVIRDARGCYPCTPDIFETTYEPVDE